MNTCEVLRSLREAGVTLHLGDDGRLKLRGPRNALTRYLHATIVEYLPEIVCLYNERAAIMQYEGGLPRPKSAFIPGFIWRLSIWVAWQRPMS